MYVDASDACNELSFQLGNAANGINGIGTRSWNIKITQYSCDYNNLAPSGCTQYYFDMTKDTVQTFNFANGRHLANQDQNICVRRERGMCRLCWSATADDDFDVSGKTTKNGLINNNCCGYGGNGLATSGFDCVIIPGAEKMTAPAAMIAGDAFCGRNGLATINNMASKTVCSKLNISLLGIYNQLIIIY